MKTAMQELKEILDKSGIHLDNKLYEVCLEKEKQQIIDAVINTSSLGENSANVFANDYYNETFKK